jgi:hypothetical protein
VRRRAAVVGGIVAGSCGPFYVGPVCAAMLVLWFTFALGVRVAGHGVGALRESARLPRVSRTAKVLLAISAIGLGWAALLLVTGGFEATAFGLTIRSHNLKRPAQAGLVALALFVWVYGVKRLAREAVEAVRGVDRWRAERTVPERLIVLPLAAAVLIFGVGWGTGVAGGSDSYGYISQADLWLRGLPIIPQPWAAQPPWPDAERTFMPLGYQVMHGGGALVPGYAVGLPLIMAAIKAVAGHAAIFWIAPVAGAALVLVTYAMGRRLDSPRTGLIAAFLVATNATLLAEVTAPMSDVLAAASLSGSLCLLLRPSPRAVIAAGLAAALAVLVRPNVAPTAALMGLWIAARRPSGQPWRPIQLAHTTVFALVASPGFLVPAWANWRLFGSPFTSGYGTLESIYDWSNVLPNAQRYVALLVQSYTALALVGIPALIVPAPRLWPCVKDRTVLIVVALFVFSLLAQYLAYEPASGEGYLRFLLPCWPAVMVAAARVLSLLSRPRWAAALIAVAVVAYAGAGARRMCESGGCDPRSERKYPAVAALVRARTEPGSVIYAFQHSGSMRYYGGRMTLRFDLLDPEWLDRSVEWFAARGIHAYVVLDAWEIERFRERFAGQQRLVRLDVPIFTYRGTVVVHFYDLSRPLDDHRPPEQIVDRFDGPRYPRPAPEFSLPRF